MFSIFYNIITFFFFIKEANNLITNIFETEEKFKFFSIASYSNGDMIFASSCYYCGDKKPKRVFYGLKKMDYLILAMEQIIIFHLKLEVIEMKKNLKVKQ